ncbi:TPA: DUF3850 domain-containing protein [Escherichia coli]|nr:DUF3850 domain-containing protein [Escherichia coli]HEA0963944.1 DUF3850 domain-containing protein [Escherichia coli]
MMAKIHEVKLHAKYFDLVLEGKKRAEFRKNDRNYERGDTLILHEWVQGVYTGRKVEARITDVTDLSDWLEDYVLLSIELLNTGAYEIVNWKELSERGLVFRINHEIMHQLGLSVMYEPETGCLAGQWLPRMEHGTIQVNRWSVHSKTGGLDNAQNTRRDTAT